VPAAPAGAPAAAAQDAGRLAREQKIGAAAVQLRRASMPLVKPVGRLRINGQRRVEPAMFRFSGKELSHPEQARRRGVGRPGHVSGMIKHRDGGPAG